MPPKDSIPSRPPRTPFPDDGPEDMELTVSRLARQPLNAPESVFDAAWREHFHGINSQPSIFARSAKFQAP